LEFHVSAKRGKLGVAAAVLSRYRNRIEFLSVPFAQEMPVDNKEVFAGAFTAFPSSSVSSNGPSSKEATVNARHFHGMRKIWQQ